MAHDSQLMDAGMDNHESFRQILSLRLIAFYNTIGLIDLHQCHQCQHQLFRSVCVSAIHVDVLVMVCLC